MPILSLLYASIARLGVAERESAITDIVARSRAHNGRHAITGMLLLADGRFAQLLEGEEMAVMALLSHIERDVRHTGLRVAMTERRGERRLHHWNMAYAGPSSYIGGHIRPLIEGHDRGGIHRASMRMVALMAELSRRNVSRYSDY